MRVTVLIKIFIVLFGILACINIALTALSIRSQRVVSDAYERKYEFITFTYDVKISSMFLTRYARDFVARSYAQAHDEYVSNEHESYIRYRNFMESWVNISSALGVLMARESTDIEKALIMQGMDLSAQLRIREQEAFDAVRNGDTRYAMELMFGSEILTKYLNPKNEILYELQGIILERTDSEIAEAKRRGDFYDSMMIVITLVFAFVSVFGTYFMLKEVKTAMVKVREAAKITKHEERLRETAEEENRAKTQFLARMSHEIRTPMNAVLGITEVELMKPGHPEETRESFSRIHRSSSLLLMVINDILDLSKVEAGKMDVIESEYSITELLTDTVSLNINHIGNKPIEFKIEVNENIPAKLIGDELRIKQILNNFLSNAFKYTSEGIVLMSVGKVGTPDKGKMDIVFTISDTGQGMSAEELGKLFESEFKRYNVQENRVVEGTGLGLSIAYQFITMMGGKVTAKSNAGEGTSFTIKIPQKVDTKEVLGKEGAEDIKNMKANIASSNRLPQIEHEIMPHAKILVVDDIETNLYVVEGYLEAYEIVPETAQSGLEAIEKVKAGNVYDIIFMDHMMPEMDGIETTKTLREAGYTNPIIALTANTVKGARELFMNSGFSGFIGKPIDIVQLNAQLEAFVPKSDTPPKPKNEKAEVKTDVAARIANAFIRDAKKAVEIMEEFMTVENPDEKDIRKFAIQAHGLKSALANIDKDPETAKILEAAANSNDMDTVYSHTPDFIKYVEEVMTELAPPEVSENMTDSNLEVLKSQLNVISDACELYDKKTARDALKTINQEAWSKETTAFLTELEARLLRSEFEEIIEAIDGFMHDKA
jgi:signal transduction histidine kinase/DNA-binding response OmpR family regulator